MSIDLKLVPIEELEKELQRRRSLNAAELRARIRELQKNLEVEQAKLDQLEAGRSIPVRSVRKMEVGDRGHKLRDVFTDNNALTSAEIESRSGFGGVGLRVALGNLLDEGFIVREGKARATRYRKA